MTFDFQKEKSAARMTLHETLARPALYYAPGSMSGVACTVRVHTKIENEGDLDGTNLSYAENVVNDPSILFLKDEVMPQRNGAVSVGEEEAYYIDHREPHDGLTVRAFVRRMSEDEARTYEAP